MTNKEKLQQYMLNHVKVLDGSSVNRPDEFGFGFVDYMLVLADAVGDENLPEALFEMFDDIVSAYPDDSDEILIMKDALRKVFNGSPILN